MTMPSMLFPADPMRTVRPDPHFAAQLSAARELDAAIAVIDHDALLAGDAATAVRRVPRDLGDAWYRGWMIPAGRYGELAGALDERGVRLLTDAARYRTAHELPGWYGVFAPVTPASVWLPWPPDELPSPAQVAELVAPLGGGPVIVKDYVKSRKHEWADACFVPDAADTAAAHRVICRMVELQEDSLAGGVVVRRFERFAQVDGRTSEARVWWVDGAPVHVGAHPDTPEHAPSPELGAIAPLVAALGCRFVTTDVALREDGAWRVVEVGDGQVSDLPTGVDPALVLGPLLS